MKFKMLLAFGAIAGGVAIAMRRHSSRAAAEAELWSEATDPVYSTDL